MRPLLTPLQVRATQDSSTAPERKSVRDLETLEVESSSFGSFALSVDSHDPDSRSSQTRLRQSPHSGLSNNITPQQQANRINLGTTSDTLEQELSNEQSMKPFIQHLEPLQRRIQTTMAGRRSSVIDDGEYWCLMVHAGAGYHSKHNENLHLAAVEE
jgi:hypothetical protein